MGVKNKKSLGESLTVRGYIPFLIPTRPIAPPEHFSPCQKEVGVNGSVSCVRRPLYIPRNPLMWYHWEV